MKKVLFDTYLRNALLGATLLGALLQLVLFYLSCSSGWVANCWLVLLVAVALALGAAWLAYRWLAGHWHKQFEQTIRQLLAQLQTYWRPMSADNTPPELRTLVEGLNQHHQQVADAQRELEELIAQRAYQLEQKNAELNEQTIELRAQNDSLSEANTQIERQRQEIISGIRAAERLQRMILPKEEDLLAIFNAAFIVNLPKDFVTGDFYWAAHVGSKAIVALGDCTGHGISGAILSILGNEIFNRVVKGQQITEPSDILKAIDEGLKQILAHNSSQHYKDGMDLSVCVIDQDAMRLDYATANSRIYLCRQQQVEELLGDKNSIGDIIERSSVRYLTQSISLQMGDMLYLASDGFADQFGGEANKKFTRKKLRQLLASLSTLPVDSQKSALVAEFDAWRGSNFQVDDVLMLGIWI